MTPEQALFSLIRSEICGAESVDTAAFQDQLSSIRILAASHDLAHIPAYALKKLGHLGDDPLSKAFERQLKEAAYRYLQLDVTYEQLRTVLGGAGIPFLPLKGSVLRKYYPEPWLRTSCDIDVLVQETRLDEAIALLEQKLLCRCAPKGDHDVSLYTVSGVQIELHYDTIQERYAVNTCRKVLARVWEDAHPVASGSFAYQMSDEMFYFYHMAHMVKHFEVGGCGIRSFLDVWILNHKVPHDRERREALLKEGGLLTFAQGAEQLAEVWFSGLEHSSLTRSMEEYILRAGTYGNNENRAAVGQAKMGGKLRYLLLRRVFMPYDFLKAEYPILKQHKWLTPVYQVVRWVRMLRTGMMGRTLRELQANAQSSKHEIYEVKTMLKQLGL